MLVKLYVNTGYVGAKNEEEIELEDEIFIDMTDKEKEQYIQSIAIDFMYENIEVGYEILEN